VSVFRLGYVPIWDLDIREVKVLINNEDFYGMWNLSI
jgi:hypothetical protein